MRVTLKSDQERSPLAVKSAIAVRRTAETALIESPVRESRSNGRIKRAVRAWKDQSRTLRHQYERGMRAKLVNNGVVSSWLVSWASEVLNRCKVQDNGRTAFDMITQHKSKVPLVGFAERVRFQRTATSKMDYKKDDGIFLGVTDRSSTYIVGNKDGIVGSPHMMALPDDEAYDGDVAAEVNVWYVGYLKDGVLQPPSMVEARVSAKVNPDKDVIKPPGGNYVFRSTKIARNNLRRHGYTAGCPGRIAMESESGRRAMHSRGCRDRLERDRKSVV